MKTIIVLLIVVLAGAIQPAIAFNDAQDKSCGACELRFKMPEGWVSESPSSKMRVAQYKLPKATGDAEDASLVVYYFGPAQGGSVEANIDRWISQMEQPGSGPAKEKGENPTFIVYLT